MAILLTNDDGITSQSIRELKKALNEVDECIVVAPDAQRSASGHAISVHDEVSVKKYYHDDTFFGYQVEGTPADCVKLALCEILEAPPTIIISGINQGPNTGVSVFYSGTVSAAREGTIAGIPSIAISMCSTEYHDYSVTCSIAKKIVQKIVQKGLPLGVTLNINVPPLSHDAIQGIKITKQAHSRFNEEYVFKGHNNGSSSYSLAGELDLFDSDNNNDEQAVQDGYISITPLKLDLTDYAVMDTIKQYCIGK